MATVPRTNGKINGTAAPKVKRATRIHQPHVEPPPKPTRAELIEAANRRLEETEKQVVATSELSRKARALHEAAMRDLRIACGSLWEHEPAPSVDAAPSAETYNPALDKSLHRMIDHELDRACSAYVWAKDNAETALDRFNRSGLDDQGTLFELKEIAKRALEKAERDIVDVVLDCSYIIGATSEKLEELDNEPLGFLTRDWFVAVSVYVNGDGEHHYDRDSLDVHVIKRDNIEVLHPWVRGVY